MPLHDVSPPRRLGRYDVLSPVARGGMASVYLGRATGSFGFEREVAIKLVHAGADATLARDLVEEAKLAVRIRHPNVVQIVDVGEDPAGVYLVMEYVEGDSVHGLIRRAAEVGERLSLAVALRILLDGLAGLHAAHDLRDPKTGAPLELVHRDVSPHNLLVGTDGVTRLADFGIAKATSSLTKTMTGMLKGKFSYMGPEQARGLALDRRADVWASGVIAWELFTGQRLYPAGNDAETLLEIASGRLPTPRAVRADLPASLDDAVMRALTRDLKSRCPTAHAFRQLLVDAAERAEIDVAPPEEVADVVRRLANDDVTARRRLLLEASDRGESPAAGEPSRLAMAIDEDGMRGAGSTAELSLSDAATAAQVQRAPLEATVRLARDEPTGTFAPAASDDDGAASAGRFRLLGAIVVALVGVGIAMAFFAGRTSSDDARTPGATTVSGVGATAPVPVASMTATASATSPVPSEVVLSGSALPAIKPRAGSTAAIRPPEKPPACKGWEKCR